MKTAHTFSFFRTTSDISHRLRARTAQPFVRHRFSLSLLRDSRRHVLLPDWTIDDATPGSTGITPGLSSTPPSLATRFSSSVLQRTSIEIPRPPSREAWTLLELSFGYITRESRQSSSFPILNQPDFRNQQDSPESASHTRTRKIPSNRQDTSNQPDSRTRQILATASLPSSHSPPQLAIASGPQSLCASSRQGTLQTFAGLWAVIPGLRALV